MTQLLSADNIPTQLANHSGSQACRLLCRQLLTHFNISGKLEDNRFPYRIVSPTQNNLFVSFSHSREQVAVLVATTPNLGIDIEDKLISEAVARRYFCQSENIWLASLESAQQQIARHLLWVIKESYIKAQGNTQQQVSLTQGLTTNIQQFLAKLIIFDKKIAKFLPITSTEYHHFAQNIQEFETSVVSQPHTHGLYCGYLPIERCGFWINFDTTQ